MGDKDGSRRGFNVGKGTRPAGRQKGTPNKRTKETLEKERIAEQAQAEVNKAAIARQKLGKEILEDYTNAFHAVAAVYQNKIVTAMRSGKEPDPKDVTAFEKWGGMVVMTAAKLADFQSPKFKAIAVIAPPPNPDALNKARLDGKVIDLNDAQALGKLYATIVKKAG